MFLGSGVHFPQALPSSRTQGHLEYHCRFHGREPRYREPKLQKGVRRRHRPCWGCEDRVWSKRRAVRRVGGVFLSDTRSYDGEQAGSWCGNSWVSTDSSGLVVANHKMEQNTARWYLLPLLLNLRLPSALPRKCKKNTLRRMGRRLWPRSFQ